MFKYENVPKRKTITCSEICTEISYYLAWNFGNKFNNNLKQIDRQFPKSF